MRDFIRMMIEEILALVALGAFLFVLVMCCAIFVGGM